jgi:hypothetical protein
MTLPVWHVFDPLSGARRRWLCLAIASLAIALAGCAPSRDEQARPAPAPAAEAPASRAPVYEPPGLRPEELHDRMAKGEKVVIVDVRSQAAYDEAHIQGAKSIPWSKLPQGYRQLPKDRLLALYCT